MNHSSVKRAVDLPVVVLGLIAVLALSLFLQHEINTRQALLFLIGLAMGFSLFHGMFGFTGGWRKLIREGDSVGVRTQIILVMLSALLFIPLIGGVFPGVEASSALGQIGVSLIIGAFLFGIGMQLGGGCGSGTLYTVGQGQMDMLLTLSFFIVGATIGSAHLPWWLSLNNIGSVSLIDQLGWLPALLTSLIVLSILYVIAKRVELSRKGSVASLQTQPIQINFLQQLVYGPWPVWWTAIALSVLGLFTLLLVGYPWSVTFAFGLWGSKIWSAVGGDISGWSYWATGYPSYALDRSVLADVTSVMDFGLIGGALLAAALAGKYAPAQRISRNRVIAGVVGGLLLGYGARLAFGCNIGALLGGIASGSLHGWLWLPAAFIGTILGVKIRVAMKLDKPA